MKSQERRMPVTDWDTEEPGEERGRAHDTTERPLSCLRPPANFAFSYWLSLLVKNTFLVLKCIN